MSKGKEVSDIRGIGFILQFPQQEVLAFEIKKGMYRGGETHSVPQTTICICGNIEVRLKNKRIMLCSGDIAVIPKNTPHIFYAKKDSVFVEWRKGKHTTKYYLPFRKIVMEQFK